MALFSLLNKYKNRHLGENMDNFATELLKEQKANTKRWFVIAMIELAIIFAIVAGFLWYNSLPVDSGSETTSVSQDSEDNGTNNYVGGDYNGKTNDKDSKDIQP